MGGAAVFRGGASAMAGGVSAHVLRFVSSGKALLYIIYVSRIRFLYYKIDSGITFPIDFNLKKSWLVVSVNRTIPRCPLILILRLSQYKQTKLLICCG